VHLIALLSGLATLVVIVELTRRRQLREKYALVWLGVGFLIAVFAVTPSLFDQLAHSLGVASPPALLTVLASLFLLTVCVHYSWEIGRLDGRCRLLAKEVALLRKDLEDLNASGGSHPRRARRPADRHPVAPPLTSDGIVTDRTNRSPNR
jgi:hypothetical protein